MTVSKEKMNYERSRVSGSTNWGPWHPMDLVIMTIFTFKTKSRAQEQARANNIFLVSCVKKRI